jgi:hypothetical protein
MIPRILFVLKQSQTSGGNEPYSYEGGGSSKSGLYNSAKFVANALKEYLGITSKLAIVVDANSIDKQISLFKPNLVILEALWAPPTKIKELIKLYPKMKWVIRVHSKTPFLANEGIALTWIYELSTIAATYPQVYIAFNAKDTYNEFNKIGVKGSIYLPNFYDPDPNETHENIDNPCFHEKGALNIGCFGAIRPLKNQLIQAIAAINYAEQVKKKLYFHINSSRIEQAGSQALKNIEALFNNSTHVLVKWGWFNHGTFVYLLSKMDASLQVSLTESFNIVAADSVQAGVPVIGSSEIDWLPFFCLADTGSALSITKKISFVLRFKKMANIFCKLALNNYNTKTFSVWKQFFKETGYYSYS